MVKFSLPFLEFLVGDENKSHSLGKTFRFILLTIWTNGTLPRNEKEDVCLEKKALLDCMSKGRSACSRTGMKHWISIGRVALLCSALLRFAIHTV